MVTRAPKELPISQYYAGIADNDICVTCEKVACLHFVRLGVKKQLPFVGKEGACTNYTPPLVKGSRF